MQSNLVTFIPIKEIIPFWPSDKFEIPGLEYVGLSQYELSDSGKGWEVDATVLILEEIKISVPGMDGFAFLVGRGSGYTEIDVEARLGDAFSAKLKDVALRLQFSSSFFKPVKKVNEKFVVDQSLKHAEVSGKVSFTVDGQGNAGFEAGKTFGISRPVMIGHTGVIIENMQLAINLDGKGLKPAGADENWQGLYIEAAVLRIPDVFDGALSVKQFGIGSGGISGTVDYANPKGERLLGLDAKLTRIALTFQQNIPTDTSIEGSIKLPFFEDWLNVGVAIGFDGDVMVRLANPKGASKLEIKEVLKFELSAISFASKDGVFAARLSGKLTPILDLAGISWPSFDIKELSIDSNGKVKLEGGWQELSRPQTVKLAGIRIEVSKVGFGTTEDGRKWFGLNGAVRLVEGVSAGASVEGLKIVWDDSGKISPQVTFNGIGVDMKVPNVLDLQGAISYADKRFVGRIKLTLYPLDKAKIDAILVVGETDKPPRYTYFAIYLAGEWNTGIPIGPVGLYGMAGLFALNYEPGKKPDEAWYEDPTNKEAAAGWYKKPHPGVTDLPKKWTPELDSLAIGAGVTLGVLPMNGYPFNGRLLLVIVFPGPVIMLEGRANLLQDRTKLDEDPLFRALAVLDGREGTFEFGLDAKYAYDKTGALIDINGSAHGFFGEPDRWHLYIGQKTPKEKRIRASLFKLFQASAYFMIDNTRLQTGAWLGYAPEPLKYGPVQVVFEAWIDGNAAVNWQPAQFHGDLWLHGKVGIQVFIIRLGLAVDAKLAADVFDPFYIMAMLGIKVEVFPFPPFAVQAKIEWKPEKITWPPLPLPLKEISVAHRLVSTNWPLPRVKVGSQGPLLLPNYESKEKGFVEGFYLDAEFSKIKMPASDKKTRQQSPVVPMDARINISFTQPVHDDILIGNNSRPPAQYIEIGDPDKKGENPLRVRFGLTELSLEKWTGNQWQTKARRWMDTAGKRQQSGEKLFGSWAPVPAVSQRTDIEQTKLWLWSETPFDYTRNSGKALEQWYTDKLPEGPCIPVPPKRPPETYEFTMLNRGDQLSNGWSHPDNPALSFIWRHPKQLLPLVFRPEISGLTVALRFPSTDAQAQPNWLTIRLPQNIEEPHYISQIGLLLADEEAVEVRGDGTAWISSGMHIPHPELGDNTRLYHVMITALPGKILNTVEVRGGAMLSVLAVTLVFDITDKARNERELRERRVLAGVTQWNDVGQVLEPSSQYRLNISTTVETQGRVHPLTAPNKTPEFNRTIIEHAYFQTQGPPGLTRFSQPIGLADNSKKDFSTGLEDLGEYVSQTMPPSIPSHGSKRLHPKPYYRAYEVGVEFNQETNYVDLMYHLAARDLMLYLYDNNDQPVRDAQGRLIVSPASWDKKKQAALLEQQQRFLSLLKNCSAGNLPPVKYPEKMTVSSSNRVLAADTAYEARLKPLLLHDDLAAKVDGRWNQPFDADGRSGPSKWIQSQVAALAVNQQLGEMRIEGVQAWKVKGSSEKIGLDANVSDLRKISALVSKARKKGKGLYTIYLAADRKAGTKTYVIRSISAGDKRILLEGSPTLPDSTRWSIQPGIACLLQSSNIWGGSSSYSQPKKSGTILPFASGTEWTDYRFTVIVRSMDDDAIGVVFRYKDSKNHYLFTMDRQRRYRRLIRVKDGHWSLLLSDDFVFEVNRDYAITIDVLGDQITIFMDNETVFSFKDRAAKEGLASPALLKGTIGFYCWANNGATFRDLSVDDLSRDASVVYRFPFTTSQFANFVHHIHSFQDEVWFLEVDAKPAWKNTRTVPLSGPKPVPMRPAGSAEGKSYDAIAKKLLGSNYLKNPGRFEVSRITDKAHEKTWALLFRSPEPIDWERAQLEFKVGSSAHSRAVSTPDAIKLIACSKGEAKAGGESVDILLRNEVDLSHCRVDYLRMPDAATPMENEVLLADRFNYTMEEDERTDSTRSVLWTGSESDFFAQAEFKNRNGTPMTESSWELEDSSLVNRNTASESMALIGNDDWTDYQFAADMALEGSGECGMLMRYKDAKNYYQLGMNADNSRWQLTCFAGGIPSLLKKGEVSGLSGSGLKLRFRVQGAKLTAYWGNGKLFEVHDSTLHVGGCGLFCNKARNAVFKDLLVSDYSRQLGRWQIHDQGNPKLGPSDWKTAHGALWQRSNIWSKNPTFNEPGLLGTFVTSGSKEWRDYRMSVQMRSDDNDAIGIMVRYVDPGNYYLLATDQQLGYTRLIKVHNGLSQTLWPKNETDNTESYTVGKPFVMELEVQGSRIKGFNDGKRLFSVSDRSLPAGGIGLFAWANTGASFHNVEVRSLPVQKNALFMDTFDESKKWRKVADDSPVKLESRDAEAVLEENEQVWAGSKKWRDFVCTQHLQMAIDGKSMGVMFRFADKENYYRFTLSVEGLYLSRVDSGQTTHLWESQRKVRYDYGYEVVVKITDLKTEGGEYLSEIELYLDGIPLCRVRDQDPKAIRSGAVGLFSGADTRSLFSGITVLPVENSFKQWLLNEKFEELDPEVWTVHDEVQNSKEGSNWSITNNELRQTSNFYGYVPGSSRKHLLGTSIIAGDSEWSDYRFMAEIRSEDDDAIGVLFRYKDANNHYRFFMDQERKVRRLVKVDQGKHSVLWEQQAGLNLKKWHLLTVDVHQDRLALHLNGETLCDIKDHNFIKSGCIGLFCWANKDARFRNIRVAPATWVTFYTFRQESALPAGTQIRMHTGSETQQPTEPFTPPTMLHRYANGLLETRMPRLRSSNETLRIVHANGSAGHTRIFDNDKSYKNQPVKILRKRDGTGFFIVPEAEEKPLEGSFKCRFMYIKNVGNSLPVLRESGSDHTEFVEINVD